ncbi:zinc finger CW-type PWWP domain protein 1-like isoform X3 [Leucoraja erinacea]|uniref:zinc finger CW-type PWWP domain protein 1-like isoform X3 n=1 Tax=Leucoraja erinaceus TaxID=7782 RepID=UPI0024562699|nr:zinc finger CW-type PWWP domain protein 1-like isoform X3 [Leucoraja erinacea]XP_055521220.1 zinc finger CW-type PWWP domain protein 1-like isoform X3 [Leucoraja erinacea]XP_055521221.1 zinc finger CW-type PWWP domain protein 1-like isoform X3 [Leucoraja erinacea]
MKDFEELRKLCCSDDADAIEMTATSNGIEKDIKKSGNFVAPTVKDILKLKKKKEVLCENSSTEIKGQNGESTEDVCLDMERKGQKNFALKQKKSVLEQKQAKTCLDEGCVNKPGKINNKNPEEKVKHKTKCVGRTAKPNKEIPTLSDSQYEMIFQSVIDKSLEECIASRKKHEVESFLEDSELLLASENTEPAINNGSEDLDMQGVRKIKTKAKDKKVNRLSRKSKSATNIHEASEVNKERRKHKRKGQPKKIVPDYTRFIDDDEETAIDNYVAWAQCGRKMCGKWRRLKDNVDPATLAKDWTCSQNPDPLYNSCDLPEEAWDGKDNDIIYAELVPGSIVWAKQSGYPWWPAMVEHDPQSGKYFMFTSDSDQCPSKYHVTFFDNIVTHAWISVSLIKSFQENPRDKSISKRDFAKRINAGRKMAEAAQKVKIQDRLPLFGFAVRYKANGDAELSEDYSSQESLEISWNVKETQRSTSREVEEDRNKDSVFKASIVAETQQEKARKEKGKY